VSIETSARYALFTSKIQEQPEEGKKKKTAGANRAENNKRGKRVLGGGHQGPWNAQFCSEASLYAEKKLKRKGA